LLTPLGFCRLLGLTLGIIVLVLGIASRPYNGKRNENETLSAPDDSLEKEINKDKDDHISAHDILFQGVIVLPLFLSVMTIGLTVWVKVKSNKFLDAGIHALIGVVSFVMSIYLLYTLITVYNNTCKRYEDKEVNPEARMRMEEGQDPYLEDKSEIREKLAKCVEKFPLPTIKPADLGKPRPTPSTKEWDNLKDRCYCEAKVVYKYELCIGTVVSGFIYALFNFGTIGLVMVTKQQN